MTVFPIYAPLPLQVLSPTKNSKRWYRVQAKMKLKAVISCCGKKLRNCCIVLWQVTRLFISRCHDFLSRVNPFLICILYLISLSLVGFGLLKILKPRAPATAPRNIDLLFTSVSASTISSLSAVEMEVFSNSQLIVMTVLMLVGGEIFTSLVGLHLRKPEVVWPWREEGSVKSISSTPDNPTDQIELSIVTIPHPGLTPLPTFSHNKYEFLKYDSIKFLGFVVLAYFLVIQALGVSSVLLYLALVSSANDVIRNKGIKSLTFSVFTAVSTFASGGFVPTNENMMVFSRNSGLLLILIPQIFLGNTLFPSALRGVIWVLGKKFKKAEAEYLLEHTAEVGYAHLLPGLHSVYLLLTVLGFVLIGFVMFCFLEWNSDSLSGLNPYQKLVGVLFQCVNARHAGETVVDLSTVAPAVLVFFAVMMYLPRYTSFLPVKKGNEEGPLKSEGLGKRRRKIRAAENLMIFSQLSYLALFVMLVCITEMKSMREDPVNFSVFNIIFEVISAYGNVGFTTGYSCSRQLRADPNCESKWYGFSGKWSDEGKLVLMVVMLFGRVKKFSMDGGRPWKLL